MTQSRPCPRDGCPAWVGEDAGHRGENGAWYCSRECRAEADQRPWRRVVAQAAYQCPECRMWTQTTAEHAEEMIAAPRGMGAFVCNNCWHGFEAADVRLVGIEDAGPLYGPLTDMDRPVASHWIGDRLRSAVRRECGMGGRR